MNGNRIRYALSLPWNAGVPAGCSPFEFRNPAIGDRDALAALMLDAYRGTIDDEGETIAEARAEVAAFLAGRPVLDASFVAEIDGTLASASLVGAGGECPVIAYVMTAPPCKQHGLGRACVARSLASLGDAGHDRVHAWVTQGNTASERLLASLGFIRDG